MAVKATYTIECNNCGATTTEERTRQPNDTLPDFVVPPGWLEVANGHLCPNCRDLHVSTPGLVIEPPFVPPLANPDE